MLNIYFGNLKEVVYNTAVYFKNSYEDDWITFTLSKEIIKDIDKSEVLPNGIIQSPVLGYISPLQLSHGSKTLILIANDNSRIFNASPCGDNCAKWLLKIAESKDLTINLRHIMNFGDGDFNIHVLNTNKTVHNMKELIPIAGLLV